MPRLLYTIEQYIAEVRKKDTIWLTFHRVYNDLRAFKAEQTPERLERYLDPKEIDQAARDEFLRFMAVSYPEVELVEVFDLVSTSHVIWPYLGSIAINADIGSDCYQALCEKYNDAYGPAKNNRAVLWVMYYEEALSVWRDRQWGMENP